MIYGYDSRTINEYGLKQLKEISIAVSPDVLRALAEFLSHAADELEQAESGSWHRHVPSALQKGIGCDVVILNGKPEVRSR